ncbi:MAG: BLUF domain-containing protein, partial [Thermomonas sp.]
FNHAQGVTGALCYDKGVFIQYFEGSSDAVERVYARIRASSLHEGLVELSQGPIDDRELDGWHMAFCQTPASILQVLANIGWGANMPITRNSNKSDPGLSQVIYHWNRWQADGMPAGPSLRDKAELPA